MAIKLGKQRKQEDAHLTLDERRKNVKAELAEKKKAAKAEKTE